MKILVVGSRNFSNYALLKQTLNKIININDDNEIISGGARGADALAKQYAIENSIKFKEFPADWNQHGKSAGYIRNNQMHEYIANFENRICIAFWDGLSKGTQHSFQLAEKYKNPIKIIKY